MYSESDGEDDKYSRAKRVIVLSDDSDEEFEHNYPTSLKEKENAKSKVFNTTSSSRIDSNGNDSDEEDIFVNSRSNMRKRRVIDDDEEENEINGMNDNQEEEYKSNRSKSNNRYNDDEEDSYKLRSRQMSSSSSSSSIDDFPKKLSASQNTILPRHLDMNSLQEYAEAKQKENDDYLDDEREQKNGDSDSNVKKRNANVVEISDDEEESDDNDDDEEEEEEEEEDTGYRKKKRKISGKIKLKREKMMEESIERDKKMLEKLKRDRDMYLSVLSKGTAASQSSSKDAKQGVESNSIISIPLSTKNENGPKLSPIFTRLLKPHQQVGVRFLYDHIVERKQGCVLADYMGLGKTIQLLSFIHAFLCPNLNGVLTNASFEIRNGKRNRRKRKDSNSETDSNQEEEEVSDDSVKKRKCILILTPASVAQNWISEVDKWVGESDVRLPLFRDKDAEYSSNSKSDNVGPYSEGEYSACKKLFNARCLDSSLTSNQRFNMLENWADEGGILIMGYEMYRTLAPPAGSKQSLKQSDDAYKSEQIRKYLCDPGPALAVLDEGHRLKHEKSLIVQAIKQIKTLLRVVLTGYPLQNHLNEYYCMIDFARPGYLGTMKSFREKFVNPITKGRREDSTKNEKKFSSQRAYVLTETLKEFVLRRDNKILSNDLPPKYEWVIHCSLTDLQARLYEAYLAFRESVALDINDRASLVMAYHYTLAIVNHPDILYKKYHQFKERASELEDAESSTQDGDSASVLDASSSKSKKRGKKSADDDIEAVDDTEVRELRSKAHSYAWAKDVLANYPTPTRGDIQLSGKMITLFAILSEARNTDDKTIVFSQSLATLDIIEDECKRRKIKFVRVDGSTSQNSRISIVEQFNERSSKFNIFLASTRACGEGINLQAANRIVMMDTCWNPCIDHEAMCRAYRYGQTKPVFVYRLVGSLTMEQRIYDIQTNKHTLTKTIVDDHSVKGLTFVKDFFLSQGDFVLKRKQMKDTFQAGNVVRNDVPTSLRSASSYFSDESVETALENDVILKKLAEEKVKNMIVNYFLADLLISDIDEDDHATLLEKGEALSEFLETQKEVQQLLSKGVKLDLAELQADAKIGMKKAQLLRKLDSKLVKDIENKAMIATRSYLGLPEKARQFFFEPFLNGLRQALVQDNLVFEAINRFISLTNIRASFILRCCRASLDKRIKVYLQEMESKERREEARLQSLSQQVSPYEDFPVFKSSLAIPSNDTPPTQYNSSSKITPSNNPNSSISNSLSSSSPPMATTASISSSDKPEVLINTNETAKSSPPADVDSPKVEDDNEELKEIQEDNEEQENDKKTMNIYIIPDNLPEEAIEQLMQILQQSDANVVKDVSEAITHVVSVLSKPELDAWEQEQIRNRNLTKNNGILFVNPEWVAKSALDDEWVDETPFIIS